MMVHRHRRNGALLPQRWCIAAGSVHQTAMQEITRGLALSHGLALDLDGIDIVDDPDMRHLIDTYLSADPSRVLTSFGGATLVELLVDNRISALKVMPSSTPKEQEAVAETIENNIGKEIVERTQSTPKYYEKMSALLRELIEKRKNDVINYEEYLRQIVELVRKVHKPERGMEYPPGIRESAVKQAF